GEQATRHAGRRRYGLERDTWCTRDHAGRGVTLPPAHGLAVVGTNGAAILVVAHRHERRGGWRLAHQSAVAIPPALHVAVVAADPAVGAPAHAQRIEGHAARGLADATVGVISPAVRLARVRP